VRGGKRAWGGENWDFRTQYGGLRQNGTSNRGFAKMVLEALSPCYFSISSIS
jgi:hypothetical protein